MSTSSITGNEVSPPDVLQPLCDSPPPTRKSPPESNALPLDRSFLCRQTSKWEVNRFVVKCFRNPESTDEIMVDLCDFVNETPDTYFQQKIELDERIYLPRHVTRSGKKKESNTCK